LVVYIIYISLYFFRLAKQSQFIPLQNVVYSITLLFVVRKIVTFYINDVLLFKCPFPGPKVNYVYVALTGCVQIGGTIWTLTVSVFILSGGYLYHAEIGLLTDSSKEHEDHVILRNVQTVKKTESGWILILRTVRCDCQYQ